MCFRISGKRGYAANASIFRAWKNPEKRQKVGTRQKRAKKGALLACQSLNPEIS
jgi:hypothetical protein